MGKESEIYIYIYIKLNHFAQHLKLTQYYKSTIPQLTNRLNKIKVCFPLS